MNPQNAASAAQASFQNVDQTQNTAITLKTDKEGAKAIEFDLLAYFAPGMALMTPALVGLDGLAYTSIFTGSG